MSSDISLGMLESAARDGNGEAQYALGGRYRLGNGVEADLVVSRQWLLRAAEQGYADAQNDVGSMLLNGMGGPKDAQIAAIWYERAAEQGHSEAQFNLALRYLHGDGVAEDAAVAVTWLWRAMEQHHVEATCELGTLFRFGRGVNQSYKVAGSLHLQAAKGGDPVAHGNLCDYHQEIAAVALSGDLQSALVMAEINSAGLGIDRNPIEGLAWALTVGTPGLPFEEDDEAERKQHAELLSTLQAELSVEDQGRASQRCEVLVGQLQDGESAAAVTSEELDLKSASTNAWMVAMLDADLMTLTDNAAYMRMEADNLSMPFYTTTAFQQALSMTDNVVLDASAIIRVLADRSQIGATTGDDPRLLIDQTRDRMGLLGSTLNDVVRSLEKAMGGDQAFALAWILVSESSVNMFPAIKSICAQLAAIEQALACPASSQGTP